MGQGSVPVAGGAATFRFEGTIPTGGGAPTGFLGRLIVLENIPSRSKPDRGSVMFRSELDNQHGETVLRFDGLGIMGRRA